MMTSDLSRQYDDFLSGISGQCSLCRAEDAHAWGDRDEIDAGPGSRRDTWHFLWLGEAQEGRPQGFICDSCIDQLEGDGRIEAYFSEMIGPRADLSEAAAATAYELGARRTRAILDLPVDKQGNISPDALAALPFALPQRHRRGPILLWQLVAAYVGRAASDDDAEGVGRMHALAMAAVGIPHDADIIQRAESWVRHRSELQARGHEVTENLLRGIEAFDALKQG